MDPDGNVTIKWDFMISNGNRYTVIHLFSSLILVLKD